MSPVCLPQYGLGGVLGQLMGHKAHRHHVKAAGRQVCVLRLAVQQCQGLTLARFSLWGSRRDRLVDRMAISRVPERV